MKGLLVKDFQLLKNQKNSYIPGLLIGIVFIFSKSTSAWGVTYLTIILASITSSTISFDQHANGMSYLLTLPVSRSNYVREKYLLLIMVTALSCILAALLTAAGFAMKHTAFDADTFASALLTTFTTATVMQSVLMPTLLKWGAEKRQIVLSAMMGGGFLIGFLCYTIIDKSKIDLSPIVRRITSASAFTIACICCAALLALMAVSFLISLRIMNKKEF